MRKPVSLFTRLLFLAAAIPVCDVPRAFADEVISGEEALRRKIRAEAKGAADSKPIKIVYAGDKRLAPVVIWSGIPGMPAWEIPRITNASRRF